MATPTPQNETVELANAVLDLPVDAIHERARLLWRLRTLVRQVPNDDAARVGLLFAALDSGERGEGLEQLAWLASRYRSLNTVALANIAGPLVMVGEMEKAANVLGELARREDHQGIVRSPVPTVLWAWLAGADDLASKLAQGEQEAEFLCAEIAQRDLGRPLAIFGRAIADTVGREACISEVDVFDREGDIDFAVFCSYRVPGERARRRALIREFHDLWRDRLAAEGFDESDYLGILTPDVLPMPERDRADA